MAASKDPAPKEEVVVAKSVTKKEVLELYNKGKNVYQIAEEVYGFDSDEARANILRILGKEDEVTLARGN